MRVLLALILLIAFSLAKADYREEIKILERKFLQAEFISINYKYHDLPEDIKSWIRKITLSEEVANFGEAYNEVDLINPELPGAQHQYTLLTDGFSASLIKVGGFFPVKWLLLVDRSNKNYACKYQLHWKVEFKEGLKYLIENKREAQGKEYLKGLCNKIESNK